MVGARATGGPLGGEARRERRRARATRASRVGAAGEAGGLANCRADDGGPGGVSGNAGLDGRGRARLGNSYMHDYINQASLLSRDRD